MIFISLLFLCFSRQVLLYIKGLYNFFILFFALTTLSLHTSRATGISLPRPYYMVDEDDERPFICSLPVDNGIMSCSDVPARREGGRVCCLDKDDALYRQSLGLSPEPLANGSISVGGLCVNWNQYYTRCHTGHKNPHKGAINFDNIAFAWIVIFQVGTCYHINRLMNRLPIRPLSFWPQATF